MLYSEFNKNSIVDNISTKENEIKDNSRVLAIKNSLLNKLESNIKDVKKHKDKKLVNNARNMAIESLDYIKGNRILQEEIKYFEQLIKIGDNKLDSVDWVGIIFIGFGVGTRIGFEVVGMFALGLIILLGLIGGIIYYLIIRWRFRNSFYISSQKLKETLSERVLILNRALNEDIKAITLLDNVEEICRYYGQKDKVSNVGLEGGILR